MSLQGLHGGRFMQVMALGTILFLPAANIPAFAFFLAALMIVAAGMTILQVSANPYVSVLRSLPEGASSRLNLTQAFNSLGTFARALFWRCSDFEQQYRWRLDPSDGSLATPPPCSPIDCTRLLPSRFPLSGLITAVPSLALAFAIGRSSSAH